MHQTPTMSSFVKDILVVLNLNGVLLFRPGGKPYAGHLQPDTRVDDHPYYFRPYMDVFLDFLFTHFHVATWTLAQNIPEARKVNEAVFEHNAQNLMFQWHRNDCEARPNGNVAKNLEKVYGFSKSRQCMFNSRNTILIDIDATQLAIESQQANTIRVPFYNGWKEYDDVFLLTLRNYLHHIYLEYEGIVPVDKLLQKHRLYSNDRSLNAHFIPTAKEIHFAQPPRPRKRDIFHSESYQRYQTYQNQNQSINYNHKRKRSDSQGDLELENGEINQFDNRSRSRSVSRGRRRESRSNSRDDHSVRGSSFESPRSRSTARSERSMNMDDA